jgi:hypothetical protein
MSARSWLWICWFALAFGAMNVYGPSEVEYSPPGDQPLSVDQRPQHRTTLGGILYVQREGEDVDLYFSYANALLGRPFVAKYVRLTDEGKSAAEKVAADVVLPTRPLWPWRDFLVEYPPAMLVPALIPALWTSNVDVYFLLFSLEMEAMLTFAVFLAVSTADALTPGSGRRAIAQCILLTAALGGVAVRRYDPCVALAIVAAIHGMTTRRPILAGVSLAIGVALKFVPLLMTPIVFLWYAARRDWRGLRFCAGAAALCLSATGLTYVVIAGPRSLDLFAYHADRPLQLETTYGAVLMLLKQIFPGVLSPKYSFGSYNVVSSAEPLLRHGAEFLEIGAILVIYSIAYRRIRDAVDDRSRIIAVVFATSACLVAFMTLGKVFSAQYPTWLVPLGAVASASSAGGARWRLAIANAFTQLEYTSLEECMAQYFAGASYGLMMSVLGLLIVGRTFALWRWVFKLFADPVILLPTPAGPATADVRQASQRESAAGQIV